MTKDSLNPSPFGNPADLNRQGTALVIAPRPIPRIGMNSWLDFGPHKSRRNRCGSGGAPLPAGGAYLHAPSQRRRDVEKFMCLLSDRKA